MDFVKFIQSVEDLIYEIVTWIALLPKTLRQVIRQPGWIQEYVTAEMDKEDAGTRFNDYLSPITFWFFLVVLPGVLIALVDIQPTVVTQLLKILPEDFGKNINFIISLYTILNLLLPVYFANRLTKASGGTLNKKSFRNYFYAQAYAFAPLGLVPALSVIFSFLGGFFIGLFGIATENNISSVSIIAYLLTYFLAFVWLWLAETRIFEDELKIPGRQAMGKVFRVFLQPLMPFVWLAVGTIVLVIIAFIILIVWAFISP